MRAFELNEEALDLESSWAEIAQKCSDIIDIYRQTNAFLYRGVVNSRPDVFRETSRIGRRPRNTDSERHELMDRWLRKNGFTATRSNSIFATGNLDTATLYSDSGVFAIFPENGAAVTWSTKIDDLWGRLPNKMKWAVYRYQSPDRFPEDTYEKYVERFMKNAGYQNTLSPATVTSRHEVMIHGSFWGIRNHLLPQVKELLK